MAARVCPVGGAPDSRKRIIKELRTGSDSAFRQLQNLLSDSKPSGDGEVVLMAVEIFRSVRERISEMISDYSVGGCEDAVSVDSGESKTRPREGRRCYKRRRAWQSRSIVNWTKEDGYAWRKYGQKKILNYKSRL